MLRIRSALFAITLIYIGVNVATSRSCIGNSYNFQGYTYLEQGGYRVWSHCYFFNPHTEPQLCGINKVWPDVYVCDPDRLLNSEKRNFTLAHQIGNSFQEWIDTFTKDCPEKKISHVQSESIVVAVVVLQGLWTADTSDENFCTNDCGELHPTHEDIHSATDEDLEVTAENFATQLISNQWKIGLCQNQLTMLYLAQQNKLWIYTGHNTKQRFEEELDDVFQKMHSIVEDRTVGTELGEAILESVELLTSEMTANMATMMSPAVIMLLAFISFLLSMLICFAIITAYIFQVKEEDEN